MNLQILTNVSTRGNEPGLIFSYELISCVRRDRRLLSLTGRLVLAVDHMTNFADLLQSATVAESPQDYWSVQNELAAAIENQERKIRRCERRHLRFRAAIKQCGESVVDDRQLQLERLRRLQSLLAANQQAEDDRLFDRGAILYLGDTLAYRLMPEHVARLHGRNSSPGFFQGKKGREQEIEIGAFLTNDNRTVLWHDLTHCLRIGDLTALCSERGILSIECGGGSTARKSRQSQRMALLNRVLNEDVVGIPTDDLTAHSFPALLVESKVLRQYNTAAFCEVADCATLGCKVVQPERGLIYAACRPGFSGANLGREVARIGSGWCNYLFASLRDRIMGSHSWVPPITLLTLPQAWTVNLLERRLYFYVFIDVDYMKKRLTELAPSLSVSLTDGGLRLKASGQDWHLVRGTRSIENVQYGLSSLESALHELAEEPQFDPAGITLQ